MGDMKKQKTRAFSIPYKFSCYFSFYSYFAEIRRILTTWYEVYGKVYFVLFCAIFLPITYRSNIKREFPDLKL